MSEGRRANFILAAADAGGWVVSLCLITWLGFDLDWSRPDATALVKVAVVAVLAQLAIGSMMRMYSGRYHAGSLEEIVHLGSSVLSTGVLVLAANIVPVLPSVPGSVPVIATLLALVLCAGIRMVIRIRRQNVTGRDSGGARRVVMLGAGRKGEHLARAMLADPKAGYLPVGFLDDSPARRGLRVHGVRVRGTSHDVATQVAATRADLVVITTGSADAGVRHEVARVADEIGVDLMTMPALGEMFRLGPGPVDLRDIDVATLLGRHQLDTGLGRTSRFLAGKRVLVTGAGGSIGAELCRQIHRFGPEELFMLDRDESALHAVRLSIHGDALMDSPDVVLADIRDREALEKVFATCAPTVVFHAAALKHLPMLEQYPLEGWKSNVLGTLNVLDAARAVGVRTFVNISTDKAANPVSVLGRSKRIGERLTADAGAAAGGDFLSVRFGNVLGSRGSMLGTFIDQVVKERPITVTHPDVTRFFMTIPEAVQLVLQAAVIGHTGDALVLDMGAQVRIVEVARQLMRMSGKPGEIVFTGLRAGEKLHEELFGAGEWGEQTVHPAISRVIVPSLDRHHFDSLVVRRGWSAVMTDCARDQDLSLALVHGRIA